MITIEEARRNIGRAVLYMARPELPVEEGTITKVNDQFVFVLYRGDYISKSTRPEDLEWLSR